MMEEWRDVVGYEGYYQVSNLGRVRRIKGGMGTRNGKIHGTYLHLKTGYVIVCLCKDCKAVTHLLHKIVAAAFLGPRPKGKQVNHKDFNKQNNNSRNLEYKSPLGNVRHAWINGRCLGSPIGSLAGEKNHQSKLTLDDVREIRRRYVKYDKENGQVALAKIFGVSQPLIGYVVRRESWKSF